MLVKPSMYALRLCCKFILKWHFSSVSLCHEWLSKKCVIAALTTRWHSALRQIPRGLSVPQRTPSPSEKLRETIRGREREAGRERGSETCALLCLYTVFECNAMKMMSFEMFWLWISLVTLGCVPTSAHIMHLYIGSIKLRAFNEKLISCT